MSVISVHVLNTVLLCVRKNLLTVNMFIIISIIINASFSGLKSSVTSSD